jgi:chemotaxis protein CheD
MAETKMLTVGVGDCSVSGDTETSIVTYALGSCVAVTVHDPVRQVGGLLHFQLPDSNLDKDRAVREPFVYADTGIEKLLQRVRDLGAEKSRLSVKVAGGAQIIDDNGLFSIGKRNCLAAKKLLWKAGVTIQSEELGGNVSRSVLLEIGSGRVALKEVASKNGLTGGAK